MGNCRSKTPRDDGRAAVGAVVGNNTQDRLVALQAKIDACYGTLRQMETDREQGNAAIPDEVFAVIREREKLTEDKDQLKRDIQDGKYFAKTADIFPSFVHDFEEIPFSEIRGWSDQLYRSKIPSTYLNLVNGFEKSLQQGGVPDTNSTPPSDASGLTPPKAGSVIKHTSQGGTDPEACIIKGEDGHRGHQGPEGKTCAPWWAPIYLWMISNEIQVLKDHMNSINNAEEEEKKKLEERLHDAIVILAVGISGGSKGMKDMYQNILYVPNPHDQFYDKGCNWVIFPIMTWEEMLNWNGGSYYVAIWAGETAHSTGGAVSFTEGAGNAWKDGKSKYTAVAAEKNMLSNIKPEEIEICSTKDLGRMTQAMAALGKGIADWHTRESDDSAYRFKVRDLEDAVQRYIATRNGKARTDEDVQLIEKARAIVENVTPGDDDSRAQVNRLREILTDLQPNEKKKKSNEITGFVHILEGLRDLEDDIRKHGIRIPKTPEQNYFGPEGKHIYKTKIKQSTPPDPLVTGCKGLNNLMRQMGHRFMAGCFERDSVSSSESDGLGSSIPRYSASTPPPPPSRVGTDVVIVTPPSVACVTELRDDDDSTLSDLSGNKW